MAFILGSSGDTGDRPDHKHLAVRPRDRDPSSTGHSGYVFSLHDFDRAGLAGQSNMVVERDGHGTLADFRAHTLRHVWEPTHWRPMGHGPHTRTVYDLTGVVVGVEMA